MFIIERRTAGVFAALAIPAAMAVLGNIWDRVNEVAGPSTANSTAAFVTSVGPDVSDNRFLVGDQTVVQATRRVSLLSAWENSDSAR